MNTNPKLTVIYGLPGSGKSYLLNQLKDNHKLVVDDFQSNALLNNPHFPYSRYFVDIIATLKQPSSVVVAEINLSREDRRKEFVSILKELVPNVNIYWICYDCSTTEAVNRCIENVKRRAQITNRKSESALRVISEFAPHFSIHSEIDELREVYKP